MHPVQIFESNNSEVNEIELQEIAAYPEIEVDPNINEENKVLLENEQRTKHLNLNISGVQQNTKSTVNIENLVKQLPPLKERIDYNFITAAYDNIENEHINNGSSINNIDTSDSYDGYDSYMNSSEESNSESDQEFTYLDPEMPRYPSILKKHYPIKNCFYILWNIIRRNIWIDVMIGTIVGIITSPIVKIVIEMILNESISSLLFLAKNPKEPKINCYETLEDNTKIANKIKCPYDPCYSKEKIPNFDSCLNSLKKRKKYFKDKIEITDESIKLCIGGNRYGKCNKV